MPTTRSTHRRPVPSSHWSPHSSAVRVPPHRHVGRLVARPRPARPPFASTRRPPFGGCSGRRASWDWRAPTSSGDIQLDGSIFDLLDGARSLRRRRRRRRRSGLHLAHPPGLWRAARQLGVLGPPPPPPAAEVRLHGRAALQGARRPGDHPPLRRRQRLLPARARAVADLLVRLLRRRRHRPRRGPGRQVRADLPQARPASPGCACSTSAAAGAAWRMHAAQHHGVDAVGITISHEQATLARERVAEAGLADRVEIRVQDYRDIADGPFDAISQHRDVRARRRWRGWASTSSDLCDLLRPGAGCSTTRISRPAGARRASRRRSFIGRYVFPDGELLEVGAVVTAMQERRLRGPRRRVAARALRPDPAGLGREPRGRLGPRLAARGRRHGPACGGSTWPARPSGSRPNRLAHPPGAQRANRTVRRLEHGADTGLARRGAPHPAPLSGRPADVPSLGWFGHHARSDRARFDRGSGTDGIGRTSSDRRPRAVHPTARASMGQTPLDVTDPNHLRHRTPWKSYPARTKTGVGGCSGG